ncbi:MAG: hypothetical protein E6R04_01725 [Spirochaetes bacterium]|nr:MAG: hypothetical protein E6R04_01725 [Spirochaetota bacterium]
MTAKISKTSLEEAISKAVQSEVAKLLESNHFSAMRQIEHMASSTSMEFEKNILDALGLENPDNMQPELQQKYFQVVQAMKAGIRSSVLDAAKQLISFPRRDDGKAK